MPRCRLLRLVPQRRRRVPAALVAVAVRLCGPFPSGRCVSPCTAAVRCGGPNLICPIEHFTVLLAAAVPVKVSVLSLVMPSPDRAAIGRERRNGWGSWQRADNGEIEDGSRT